MCSDNLTKQNALCAAMVYGLRCGMPRDNAIHESNAVMSGLDATLSKRVEVRVGHAFQPEPTVATFSDVDHAANLRAIASRILEDGDATYWPGDGTWLKKAADKIEEQQREIERLRTIEKAAEHWQNSPNPAEAFTAKLILRGVSA